MHNWLVWVIDASDKLTYSAVDASDPQAAARILRSTIGDRSNQKYDRWLVVDPTTSKQHGNISSQELECRRKCTFGLDEPFEA